jgi:hypothetical protein
MLHDLLEKSKLDQNAYEVGYQVYWKEAVVLQTEPNKHKESAHMFLVSHLIRQPSWDIFHLYSSH